MRIGDVMTQRVHTIEIGATLAAAAEEMRARDVGSLPVLEGEKVVGMVTDRDLVIRGLANGKDPGSTAVREAMTPRIDYCYEDEPVGEALRTMEEFHVRRLLVVDRERQVVGLISQDDLAHVAPQELHASDEDLDWEDDEEIFEEEDEEGEIEEQVEDY